MADPHVPQVQVTAKDREAALFLIHVRKTRGCWLWKGQRTIEHNRKGFRARFYANGKTHQASHIAWKLFGDKPKGSLFVLHHCDNGMCVKPSHLFLGTQSDNIRDAVKKRRHSEARKTHCPHGHPYSKANTARWGNYKNNRRCRKCDRNRWNRLYGKKSLRRGGE